MNHTSTYPPKSLRPAIGGYRYFFNGQEMERGSEQSKKRQCLFLL